jgi:hypothetical protein
MNQGSLLDTAPAKEVTNVCADCERYAAPGDLMKSKDLGRHAAVGLGQCSLGNIWEFRGPAVTACSRFKAKVCEEA